MNGRPNDWEFTEEKSVNWSKKEIEQFIKAAERIPELLRKKVKVFRMIKSNYGINPASSSKNVVVLYDKAFSPKENLSRIFIHELAHELYRDLSIVEKERFQKDMSWTWTGSKWKPGRDKYVTHDSDTSPEEDFANGIEHYVFRSTRLKFRDPKMQKWLNSKYGAKLELER